MKMRRPGLVYLALLVAFLALIGLRIARDASSQSDRAALFLERCRLEASESDCTAALTARETPCESTWYGPNKPEGEQWAGYYACVRGH